MNQRRTQAQFIVEPDPLAGAVFVDTQGIAGDLEAVLEALKGYDHSSIKAIIFRKPPGGLGAFEWIEDVPAPIDMSAIMTSLKTRFGGGSYRVQIFAGGKTRKNVEFSIFGDPKAAGAPAREEGFSGDIFRMMMLQQADARREQVEYQRRADERADRVSERQLALLGTVMAAAVPALIPILSGANREKLSDIIALMQANKPEPNNLKDTVETLVAVKGLLGDGDRGGLNFNPDDVAGSIARLAGPVLSAAGRAFGQRGAPPAEDAEAPAGDGQIYLPPPTNFDVSGQVRGPQLTAAPASTGSPVLDLIRPHVLYFFNAHLDPGLAAEAIADIMDREGVAEGDVNGLVATFSLSADWKAELAAHGLDLRSDPEWADQFLDELVSAWTAEGVRDGDGGARGGGGVADAGLHAGASAPQLAEHDDPPSRGTARDKGVRGPSGPPAKRLRGGSAPAV